MKKITLRKTPEGTLLTDVIKGVMGNSPNKSIGVEDMRRRVIVIEAVEAMKDGTLILEDADYKLLSEAFNTFPWQQANRALVNLIDDILGAENYSFLKVVENEPEEEAKEAQNV